MPDAPIILDVVNEGEHGALIPVDLAPDEETLLRLTREALGHHPNFKRGPYVYVEDFGGYRRVAPHLSFMFPESFTAYHVG